MVMVTSSVTFEMNENTFFRSIVDKKAMIRKFCHFRFCLSSLYVSTLKEKNLLQQEQILSFKSRPPCGRVLLHRKENRNVTEVLPLRKK